MSEDLTNTPIEVLTASCWYTGLLATRGFRVADVLNDPSREVIDLREARTRLVGVEATDVRWRQISVRKDQIVAVIPMGSYEAPTRRRARYVEKPRFGAMAILPGVVLSGAFHLPPRVTPVTLLHDSIALPTFLGMTDVTLHCSPYGFETRRFDVVVLRRPSIESVQLTSKPLPRYGAGEAERAETDEVPAADG